MWDTQRWSFINLTFPIKEESKIVQERWYRNTFFGATKSNTTQQNHVVVWKKNRKKILWICSVAHSIHVFRPVKHAQFNRIDTKMVNCSVGRVYSTQGVGCKQQQQKEVTNVSNQLFRWSWTIKYRVRKWCTIDWKWIEPMRNYKNPWITT